MAPITLGYWKLRGLGQSIRFLLEYTESEYVDTRYTLGPAPEFARPEWLEDKANLGMPFPNLPYIIDGDLKLSQSAAVLKYLARKHDLTGNNLPQHELDVLEGVSNDLGKKIAAVCYDPKFEEKKVDFCKEMPSMLKNTSEYLGTKSWFAGKLSYIDFVMYEHLWRYKDLHAEAFDQFPNLSAYLNRFENLPQIKKYMESDRFLHYPIYASTAKYGGAPTREIVN